MKIEATLREIMDSGLWEDFCELTGTNPWCLNEGADENASMTVPIELAQQFLVGVGKSTKEGE